MADPHSTPDTPIAKTDRTLIVGYRPQGTNKSTPSLTLSGKWLRDAGFDTGQQVTVKVAEGCLVLMTGSEQEQTLLAELKAAQRKLKEIEEAMAFTH